MGRSSDRFGCFVDVGDYLQYLVRHDRADARREWVRAAIDENVNLTGVEASQAVNEIFAAILQD